MKNESEYLNWLHAELSRLGVESSIHQKSDVYEYIDKNGIPFHRSGSLGFSISLDGNHIAPTEWKRSIKIRLPFEGLSAAEQDKLVIDYIKDSTGYAVEDINDLENLKSIEGNPFILELNSNDYGMQKFCLPFSKIPGSLILRGKTEYRNGDGILTLAGIEEIHGDLGIDTSPINSLGSLQLITGNMWFSGTNEFKLSGFQLKSLSPIRKIFGDLTVRAHSVESLGSLERVIGNVSLRFSSIRDLGSLSYVGGNLLVSKRNLPFYDLSRIQVKGQIRRYNDPPVNPDY
jgi:hypothetical protein